MAGEDVDFVYAGIGGLSTAERWVSFGTETNFGEANLLRQADPRGKAEGVERVQGGDGYFGSQPTPTQVATQATRAESTPMGRAIGYGLWRKVGGAIGVLVMDYVEKLGDGDGAQNLGGLATQEVFFDFAGAGGGRAQGDRVPEGEGEGTQGGGDNRGRESQTYAEVHEAALQGDPARRLCEHYKLYGGQPNGGGMAYKGNMFWT